MRIGELARRASVSPKTIRYYEDIGVLARPLQALIEDLRRLHEDLRQLARQVAAAGRCTASGPPGRRPAATTAEGRRPKLPGPAATR